MSQHISKATQISQTVAWESYVHSNDKTETTSVALRLEGGRLTIDVNGVVHTVGLPPEVSDAIADMFAARRRHANAEPSTYQAFARAIRNQLTAER